MGNKLRCVFMGTPQFSVPTLEALSQCEDIELIGVVSMPDRPAGRGQHLTSPAVAQFAKDHSIKLFQTANINKEESFFQFCKQSNPDFFLVLSFAQFLNQKTLNTPSIGCFNIHTSLLPKYRGAAPIHYALLNGDSETGVTIQKMVKKMDAGDICTTIKTPIENSDDVSTLSEKLSKLSIDATMSLIDDLKNKSLKFVPQDETHVSFAPEFSKEFGFVDFSKKSAVEIFNQFRALRTWPGLYFFISGVRYKVHDLQLSHANSPGEPGTCDLNSSKMIISTMNGCIEITSLQQEGKKAISSLDFMNLLKSRGQKLKFKIEEGSK